MNWPLLPVMPELDELEGAVDVEDVALDGEVVLDPLDVLIEPFHEPRQPVYVTGLALPDEYDEALVVLCPLVEPGCEPVEPDWLPVAGVCAPTVIPAMAMAPQVAMMLRVMRASCVRQPEAMATSMATAGFAPRRSLKLAHLQVRSQVAARGKS